MRTFHGIDGVLQAEDDLELGTSEWVTVDQEMIDTFADATGDHQWIHVDPQRAAEGPFGATIAHGYLTLSLLPRLVGEVYEVEDVGMRINYGLDKVRFLAPVSVDSRVRATTVLTRTEAAGEGGARMHLRTTVEIEGGERPACVADSIVLLQA